MARKAAETKTQTLKKLRIAGDLRSKILFRELLPGTRLREAELAEQYGTGRPLIREVLQLLDLEGLIEHEAWRGAQVTQLTETQLSDIFELVSLLFGLSVRKATQRADETQLAQIKEHVFRLKSLAECGANLESYYVERQAAHESIAMAAGAHDGGIFQRSPAFRVSHQFTFDGIKTREKRVASSSRWESLYEFMATRDALGAEHQACMMILSHRSTAIAALHALQQ